MTDLTVTKEVYRFVLTAVTNSFAENVKVDFCGVRMTSVDGDVVEIKDREWKHQVEQMGGGKVKIYIDVVNDDEANIFDLQSFQKRIDYMIDDEYTPEVLATITNNSTKAIIPWTLEESQCCQTTAKMKIEMASGVEEAILFLTSAAVEFDDDFIKYLVENFNAEENKYIVDFITNLANL